MIGEIKNYELQKVKSELQSYKEIIEQIDSLQKQVEDLRREWSQKNHLMPYKKFNWIQKHITQRNEYKNYTKENKEIKNYMDSLRKEEYVLSDKIIELGKQEGKYNYVQLQEQANKIEQAKTLKDLGLNFHEAIQFLESNNIEVVLTDEDKYITPQEKDYNGLEDFILVHKTDYEPTQTKIKSAKDSRCTCRKTHYVK